jgi:3-hydroxyacyl-[acyl-carrier-protein] dehydratase
VDRVVDCRPGEHIRTVKAISGSEPCYASVDGGPPRDGPNGDDVTSPRSYWGNSTSSRAVDGYEAYRLAYRYPQSLLLESLVQAAGVLWAVTTRERGGAVDGTLVLAGVREVSFHRPVFPGDTVHHVVDLDRVVGSNAFCTGRTVLAGADGSDGAVVTTVAQLVLAMRPAKVLGGRGS